MLDNVLGKNTSPRYACPEWQIQEDKNGTKISKFLLQQKLCGLVHFTTYKKYLLQQRKSEIQSSSSLPFYGSEIPIETWASLEISLTQSTEDQTKLRFRKRAWKIEVWQKPTHHVLPYLLYVNGSVTRGGLVLKRCVLCRKQVGSMTFKDTWDKNPVTVTLCLHCTFHTDELHILVQPK